MQIQVRAHCASCLATTQKTTSWWLTSPQEVFAGLLSPLSLLGVPTPWGCCWHHRGWCCRTQLRPAG